MKNKKIVNPALLKSRIYEKKIKKTKKVLKKALTNKKGSAIM